jgi:hypothetical protein
MRFKENSGQSMKHTLSCIYVRDLAAGENANVDDLGSLVGAKTNTIASIAKHPKNQYKYRLDTGICLWHYHQQTPV